MSETSEDERLRRLAEGYNDPPEAPREAMWAAVRRGLEGGRRKPREGPAPEADGGEPGGRGVPRWAWAAAALLVLGVAVGRWTAPSPTDPAPVPVATRSDGPPGPAGGTVPVRQAAYRHLSATGSFLTGIRADLRRGRMDPNLAPWADRLLTETWLLMDSPVSDDPELGPLLEDLELVLLQVRQAARFQGVEGERAREEIELLSRGMDANDMSLRIDAALPPSVGMTGT